MLQVWMNVGVGFCLCLYCIFTVVGFLSFLVITTKIMKFVIQFSSTVRFSIMMSE